MAIKQNEVMTRFIQMGCLAFHTLELLRVPLRVESEMDKQNLLRASFTVKITLNVLTFYLDLLKVRSGPNLRTLAVGPIPFSGLRPPVQSQSTDRESSPVPGRSGPRARKIFCDLCKIS